MNKLEIDKWQAALSINTPESYRNYMESYPQGLYTTEAQYRLEKMLKRDYNAIMKALQQDSNAYSLTYLKMMGMTPQDLYGFVPDEVLRSWDKIANPLPSCSAPFAIPQGRAEVYFWGSPSSGKTCVLASILNSAYQMGFCRIRRGVELEYMNELLTLFNPQLDKPAVHLPLPSQDAIQCFPLQLDERMYDKRGKLHIKEHLISMIEVPGCVFKHMNDELKGQSVDSESYEQLKKYLKSEDNPKYHFFILDGSIAGSEQMDYLNIAASYLRHHNVFGKSTMGICIVVTKCDQLSSNRHEWVEKTMNHIKEHNRPFIDELKRIIGLGGLELTNGFIQVFPFSIGEVFFKELCLFDPESARILVGELMKCANIECNTWKNRLCTILQNRQNPQIVTPINTNDFKIH